MEERLVEYWSMLKKIAIGFVAVIAFVLVFGWLFTANMERRMDSTRLVALLDATPAPTSELVMIDSWNRDGDWLFKPRDPEAVRMYVGVGSVDDNCAMLDDFYQNREMVIVATSMSGDPDNWCGRSVHVDGDRVSIWVEVIKPWREIPEVFIDQRDLVEIRYSAYGG